MVFPVVWAAANHAALAIKASCRAISGVSPKAEQNFRSGISAMYPSSAEL